VASIAQKFKSHMDKSVLLVEPDDLIRQSLLSWLRRAMPEWAASGAPGTDAAIAVVQARSPDLILVDIADREKDGLETIRAIKGALPRATIVALAMHDDEAHRDDSVLAGANAHLLIWEIETGLLPTVRTLLGGESTQGECETPGR
jgi:DNA-binding NarL/FixJ family response regulator